MKVEGPAFHDLYDFPACGGVGEARGGGGRSP